MKLPRFTVRRLVLVVALVAIAMGGWRAYRLSGVARSYSTTAMAMRSLASGFRFQAADSKMSTEFKSDYLHQAEEMEEVARIYERAASRPWLPVTFETRSP